MASGGIIWFLLLFTRSSTSWILGPGAVFVESDNSFDLPLNGHNISMLTTSDFTLSKFHMLEMCWKVFYFCPYCPAGICISGFQRLHQIDWTEKFVRKRNVYGCQNKALWESKTYLPEELTICSVFAQAETAECSMCHHLLEGKPLFQINPVSMAYTAWMKAFCSLLWFPHVQSCSC